MSVLCWVKSKMLQDTEICPGWMYKLNYSCIFVSYLYSIFPSLESSSSSLSSSCLFQFHFFLPFLPLYLSFSLLCYACFCRRIWPQAVLLTQHLFPYSLPFCSLPLPFYLVLASSLPPPSLPLSRLRSLKPVNFQTSFPRFYFVPSPSLCLISFQIFASEWPYSSSVLSCPAKIR